MPVSVSIISKDHINKYVDSPTDIRVNKPAKKRKFRRPLKATKSTTRSHTRQRKCETTCSLRNTHNLNQKAKDSLKYVKNLSDRKISDIETIALGKGLKFIITPEKPSRISILKSLKDLTRRMRIRFVMQDKKHKLFYKFRLPSTWSPQMTYSRNLEDYLEATKEELAKIPIQNAPQNISKAEKVALRSLAKDRSVILKPFDKGRGIAILNRTDYQAEIERQLKSHHYQKLDSDITHATTKVVVETLQDILSKKEIDKEIFDYLNPLNHDIRTPVIYILPKVHKAPPANSKFAGRPIISGNGSPTEKISEFVDYFLLPIVVKQHTYVKDTNHILNLLEATPLPETVTLATLDVVSMYTNTPQDEALDLVQKAYSEAPQSFYEIKKISPSSMRKLVELILTRNCFEFNGQFYLQKIGCAMGSQASPEICDIVMHPLEERIISTDPNIIKWLRYRDDILLYKGTRTELCNLVENLNASHEFFKFTAEISSEEVTYLDLKIFKGERFRSCGILDTKVFTKSTETYQYLDRNSAHPLATFKGFIKGEVLRYARLCSNISDFQEKKDSFIEKLLMRNYSRDEIESATSAIKHTERSALLTTEPKTKVPPLVFKVTYTPHVRTTHIKNALTKHWYLISEHEQLKKLFPNNPIIAYKRAKNLKDLLVRSRFENDSNPEETASDDTFLDALLEALEQDNDI